MFDRAFQATVGQELVRVLFETLMKFTCLVTVIFSPVWSNKGPRKTKRKKKIDKLFDSLDLVFLMACNPTGLQN